MIHKNLMRDKQHEGVIKGVEFEVYYDDNKSSKSDVNQYAVFTDKGFMGWLPLGFTNSDLYDLVKSEVKKYLV
jgi:hypothetical protein